MRLDQTWHLFAWLIVTAVVYYYVGKLVVVLFLCWLALIGWLWFARRWPRIALLLAFLLRGLLGGRGRRRW